MPRRREQRRPARGFHSGITRRGPHPILLFPNRANRFLETRAERLRIGLPARLGLAFFQPLVPSDGQHDLFRQVEAIKAGKCVQNTAQKTLARTQGLQGTNDHVLVESMQAFDPAERIVTRR
ncbi:hypothetical protein EGT07_07680 [Herbaspirillum sp. HC18]|nr:hypothetical protein EGT07_07680 [Herbaspirillum sp. HC18]